VGLTSYGIYLWQELFTGPVEDYHGAGVALTYLLPLLGVIVPISYYMVEKPAMQLGKSLSQKARQAASERKTFPVT
jgi:peptidoglycan/LPS O-acetylase OafA/YrhL